MTISAKAQKLLWAAAAGRCSFPDCGARLCFGEGDAEVPYLIGEMAHICGDKPGSNRHDPDQAEVDRNDYRNLILLCPTHHSTIDKKENERLCGVEFLMAAKDKHESRINRLVDGDGPLTRQSIAQGIMPLLVENRRSWQTYGPLSEFARKNYFSESAHNMWLTERLSTILPNNRKILKRFEDRREVFSPDEQDVIACFLLHARAYERWVRDEISYDGVVPFPVNFYKLIEGLVND